VDIPASWRKYIEDRVRPLFVPDSIKTLEQFAAFAAEPKINGVPLKGEALVTFNMARRLVGARARSVERELQFRQLKRRTFVITPLIGLAFIAFTLAANPGDLRRVPVAEKEVAVNEADLPVLRAALADPACVGRSLRVIVLGEWASGVQDVVTVPAGSCPPVRLQLDHGRFSAAR
jgi:hypothetical protein